MDMKETIRAKTVRSPNVSFDSPGANVANSFCRTVVNIASPSARLASSPECIPFKRVSASTFSRGQQQ